MDPNIVEYSWNIARLSEAEEHNVVSINISLFPRKANNTEMP